MRCEHSVNRLPVVGAVDHRAGDIVIHEDEQRQTEAETHGAEYRVGHGSRVTG